MKFKGFYWAEEGILSDYVGAWLDIPSLIWVGISASTDLADLISRIVTTIVLIIIVVPLLIVFFPLVLIAHILCSIKLRWRE